MLMQHSSVDIFDSIYIYRLLNFKACLPNLMIKKKNQNLKFFHYFIHTVSLFAVHNNALVMFSERHYWMRLKSWQRKTAKPVSERAAPGFLSSPDHPLPWPLASNSKPSRNFLKSLVPSVQTLAWYVNLSNRLEVFSMTLFFPPWFISYS